MIEYISSNSKRGVVRFVFTYGGDRFLAERKVYLNNKLDAVHRYEYETDEYGNWIKQSDTIFGPEYSEYGFTPSSVVYRDITYYRQ